MGLQKQMLGKFKVRDVKEVEKRLTNEKKNNGEKLGADEVKNALKKNPQFFVKGEQVFAGDVIELDVQSLDAKELMGREMVEPACDVSRKVFKVPKKA